MSRSSQAALALLVLTATIRAADPDPLEIAKRMAQAIPTNWERQRQYTFRDHISNREYGSKGQETSRHSWTYEIVRLADTVYAKLILFDEKALTPKQAKQQDDLFREAEERRKIATLAEEAQRQSPVVPLIFSTRQYSYSVPFVHLADIFDVQYVGAGESDGRPAYKLEAKPKPGFPAKTANEKESRNYSLKLLVDQEDGFPAVVEAEIVGGDSALAKTSFWRMEYTRLSDGTWFPKVQVGRLNFKQRKTSVEFSSQSSGFRKFQVNAEVLSADDN